MMWHLHLLLLAFFWSSPADSIADWTDCPTPCHCKWTTGKKSAFCTRAGFTDLPNSLHSDIQVLDLTGNNIPYLTKEAFKTVGLLNLQRIFLKDSGVREVHSEAFKELTILVEVDLSDNLIASLHRDTFAGNERLKVLYLNGNPLTELHPAQFPKLPSLKTLEMQHCQIKKIHKDAFIHLPSLEIINLNGNRLKNLSENVFLPVTMLKSLSLDGNQWKCDCHLREFRNWLLSSNLYSHSLICKEPASLASREWETVDPVEFSCPPSVRLSEMMIQEEPGENVTLRCRVDGDPEPQVSWLLNGRIVGNSSREQLLEEVDQDEDGVKWATLNILNVSEEDAGEYTCTAKNVAGQAAINLSLILPQVVIATTVSKTETWFVWAVWTGCGSGFVLMLASTVCLINRCACSRRPHKMKASESYIEQDKKLLEVSITTTTDRQTGSCGSQADMELLEQSIDSDIRLESEPVYQPPPEFSTSILPIFISVAVEDRYPDLLDLPHRDAYFATLPKRHKEPEIRVGPHYDNMGPRVTAAGSSTLSLPGSGGELPATPPPPPNCTPVTLEYVSL